MAATVSWLGYFASDANSATYNFGTITVPRDGLLVAVAVSNGTTSRVINGVLLGGVAASYFEAGDQHTSCTAIGTSFVSAGDVAVSITQSGTAQRAGVGLWLVEGASSATPYDSQWARGSSISSVAMVMDYPAAGGVGVYGLIKTSANNVTWDNATERADLVLESSSAGAWADRSASGAAVSETPSWGASALVAHHSATWAPGPENTVPPVVSGSSAVGSLLSCSTGTWTDAFGHIYQWLVNGTAIVGATDSTFDTSWYKVGDVITCEVIGLDANGGFNPFGGVESSNSITLTGTLTNGTTIVFDNGVRSDGLVFNLSRNIPSVSPLGEQVLANQPRYGKPFPVAERTTWSESTFPNSANGIDPFGVGTLADGSPCILYYVPGGGALYLASGPVDNITPIRGYNTTNWAPTGAPPNTTYYTRSAICHLGMIVLLCERIVSEVTVGTTIITSADEFQTFQIHDLPANTEAEGEDAGIQRGRNWSMSNAFPMVGRTWETGFWVPFADYLNKAGLPKGGQIGLIGFTRDSASDPWTVGGLRTIYDRWESGDPGGHHAHTAAITTGGVMSVWGDGVSRNMILFHKLDLADYENAEITTTVASGGFSLDELSIQASNQPVAAAPGRDAGSWVASCDLEYDVIQFYSPVVDSADEMVIDGLYCPNRTITGGVLYSGADGLHLHHSPLTGCYVHGGGSARRYMVSRNGVDFAWVGRVSTATAKIWLYGNHMILLPSGGGTIYHTPIPRVKTVRPLLCNPGGENAYDGTFQLNESPDEGITNVGIYLDGDTWKYESDGTPLAVQPPLDMPFDPSQAIVRHITSDNATIGRRSGRYYVTAGDHVNGLRNDLTFQLHLKKAASGISIGRHPVSPNESVGVVMAFWRPFHWHPISVCKSTSDTETESRIRVIASIAHASGEYWREASTILAHVHSTKDKGFTSYPVPRVTTAPDELGVVSSFSVPANSFAFRAIFQIPYDACLQLPVAMPLATLYQDADNYIEIVQTAIDEVTVDVVVDGNSVGSLTFTLNDLKPSQIVELSLTLDGDALSGRAMVAELADVIETDTLSAEPTGNYTEVRFSSPDQTVVGNLAVAGLQLSDDPTELPDGWFIDALKLQTAPVPGIQDLSKGLSV